MEKDAQIADLKAKLALAQKVIGAARTYIEDLNGDGRTELEQVLAEWDKEQDRPMLDDSKEAK